MASGGTGGFGGGGGGGGGAVGISAGAGGFGGGGAGQVSTSASGGRTGSGGFGGGEGGLNGGGNLTGYPSGGGGGGAGFGGAVFVRDGGTLTIIDSDFTDGTVTGGAGGASDYTDSNNFGGPAADVFGGTGQAAGTAMFLQGSGTITYEADTSETISDTIVDEEGWVVTTAYSPPTGYVPGSYTVDKTGAGTLTLSGANAYSGGTTIEDGTLDLTVFDAAGIGAINFGGDPNRSNHASGSNSGARQHQHIRQHHRRFPRRPNHRPRRHRQRDKRAGQFGDGCCDGRRRRNDGDVAARTPR